MGDLNNRRIQLIRDVNMVLHLPGNFTGPVLEMALVVDTALPEERARDLIKQLCIILKNSGETFRNVRLNFILWKGEGRTEKSVVGMSSLILGRGLENYERTKGGKNIEPLLETLKKFYARSKLVILLSDGSFTVESAASADAQLKPFLGRKLIWILEHSPVLALQEEKCLFAWKNRLVYLEEDVPI